MAGLFYFLPDVFARQLLPGGSQLARSILVERGLGGSLADVETDAHASVMELVHRGPGGKCGTLVYPYRADGQVAARLGFYPDAQRWVAPFDEPDRLWIGHDLSDLPTPEDLRRRGRLVTGADVELADGRAWTVPLIKRLDGHTSLRCELYFDQARKVQRRLPAASQELWERAGRFCKLFLFGGEYCDDEAVAFALDVLALNYRLGQAEQNALGLLGSTEVREVIEASTDVPFALAWLEEDAQKKSYESETSSSSPGGGESSPATTLAGES